jgi:DNA-binding transcriptional MerR regulator
MTFLACDGRPVDTGRVTAVETPLPAYGIAETAQRTGLTAHTLRYYERDGLMLRSVARSASGHRLYSETDLRWIGMIGRLRATGMPISDVRRYAELVRLGEGNEQERLKLLRAHQRRVRVELAEITGHLEAIDAKIGSYVSKLESQRLDLERARSR